TITLLLHLRLLRFFFLLRAGVFFVLLRLRLRLSVAGLLRPIACWLRRLRYLRFAAAFVLFHFLHLPPDGGGGGLLSSGLHLLDHRPLLGLPLLLPLLPLLP